MKRKIEEDEDDVEISMKNELICLILRKLALMTPMISFVINSKNGGRWKNGGRGMIGHEVMTNRP